MNKNESFFPYEPYEIQNKFIECVYQTLMNKRAGIFDSPTGTGKSLSLLSGILNFLRENKKSNTKHQEKVESHLDSNWLNNFNEIEDSEIFLVNKKRKFSQFDSRNSNLKSDINNLHLNKQSVPKNEVSKMLIDDINKYQTHETVKNFKTLQVYYCTRTHSQISQVISEIKKIKLKFFEKYPDTPFEFSFSSVASRKHLCINNEVRNQNSISKINEKCLELNESTSKCKFYNKESIESLSNEITKKVFDIEDIYKLGKEIACCPYYACRRSMDNADIIVLPYNSIINPKIRKSMNIDLENKVIIFDEAHNIVECILQTFNAEINIDYLLVSLLGLNIYYEKYGVKLKPSNNMFSRQIIKILRNIIRFISINKISKFSITEFLIENGIANIDFFKLIEFVEAADLQNKLKWTVEKWIKECYLNINNLSTVKNTTEDKVGYIDCDSMFKKYLNENEKKIFNGISLEKIKKLFSLYSSNIFNNVFQFISCFVYTSEDGNIIANNYKSSCSSTDTLGSLKYVMINPCREFDHILKSSKCVLFAGGTMKPLEEFQILLKSLNTNEIEYFEGTHVINKSNVFYSNFTVALDNFESLYLNHHTFKEREDFLLKSILSIVRFHSFGESSRGIVVFMQTYSLIEKLKSYINLDKTPWSGCIDKHSDIFYEDKVTTDTFNLYSENIISNHRISVLFSVIGGRLSEGINFSDDLARIVLVFGLPYPNITDLELRMKMNYYDELYKKDQSKINGEEYYENICLKAVNQSIGRSIRHSNDHCAIVLVDHRYSNQRIRNKLPSWILNSGNSNRLVNDRDSLMNYKRSLEEFFIQFKLSVNI